MQSEKRDTPAAIQINEKSSAEETWKIRLSHLPPEEQAHIAKKYYGGHYPWKG